MAKITNVKDAWDIPGLELVKESKTKPSATFRIDTTGCDAETLLALMTYTKARSDRYFFDLENQEVLNNDQARDFCITCQDEQRRWFGCSFEACGQTFGACEILKEITGDLRRFGLVREEEQRESLDR